MMEDIIGYLGGIFIIMISFIPQVIKSYKTKSVGDLSLMMILATFIGYENNKTYATVSP